MKSHLSPSDIEKLRGAVIKNREAYEDIRSPRSGRRTWDYIVLTAANQRQARGYEIQIKRRQENGWIPESTKIMVIPDPGDQRVGSGAATLNAIRIVGQHLQAELESNGFTPASLEALFANRRILILHSGGDSRRIPHYSPYGKAFATVPLPLPNGPTSTVFDEMLIALATFPERMEEGVVVASGDVVLAFSPDDINLRWPGVTGVAFRAPWHVGTKHGVYVQSADRTHVQLFLQKPSFKEMSQASIIDSHGDVCLDSGLLRFDLDTTCLLARLEGLRIRSGQLQCKNGLAAVARKAGIPLDVYDEILRVLAPGTEQSSYLGDVSGSVKTVRSKIWKALRGIPFRVAPLAPAYLLHVGTTRQFRQLLTQSTVAQQIYEFSRRLNTTINVRRLPASVCIYDSIVADRSSRIGRNVIIESCNLKGYVHLEAGAILHGISDSESLFQPDRTQKTKKGVPSCSTPSIAQTSRTLHISNNVVAHCVPVQLPKTMHSNAAQLKMASVFCLYGVGDDPKLKMQEGATLFGTNLIEWLNRRGIDPCHVWPHVKDDERSLWNARLYPVLGDKNDIEIVLWMQDDQPPSPRLLQRWKRSYRLALADTLEYVDYEQMCRNKEQILLRQLTMGLEKLLPQDADLGTIWNELNSAQTFRAAAQFVRSWLSQQSEPLIRMRGFKFLADMFDSKRLRSCLRVSFRGNEPNPMAAKSKIKNRKSEIQLPPSNDEDAWKLISMPQLDSFVCDALAAFFRRRAFEEVRHVVAAGVSRTIRSSDPRRRSRRFRDLKTGQQVIVTSPARVDFGGGWSDTPPHSLRRGGTVLNVAIRLNGQQPICATVRILPDPVLKLVSKDAGVEREIEDWQNALDHDNPSDAVALHKAAICCTAMVIMLVMEQEQKARGGDLIWREAPDLTENSTYLYQAETYPGRRKQTEALPTPGHSLSALRSSLSGLGLEVITETDVPQGSGLGTSSILGAVVLRALFELSGIHPTNRQLFSYVSNLEQMMSTGGGWQDQIGGIVPGIKLITTRPGTEQIPRITHLKLSARTERELSERMLLFYVGERRIAKDILQSIMGKYISGDATTLHILTDIQRIAREMRRTLEVGDLDGFGTLMWEHWELNKELDPQSTTPRIEEIVEQIRPFVSGLKMVGAGGGGFMEIVCKQRYRRALESLLMDLGESEEATVYRLEIDNIGTQVETENRLNSFVPRT